MRKLSDRSLIAAARRSDARAFGELYRRHRDVVLAFFLTRTGDAELAADLTAEAFANALVGCHRYRDDISPLSWLLAIARRELSESRRHGAVDQSARRRLALARLELDDDDLERIAELGALLPTGAPSAAVVELLPEARREALRARILDELEHPSAAPRLRLSGAVARRARGARRTETEQ